MASLAEHLGTSLKGVDDETLLLLRLLGRRFGRPVNFDLGESVEDTLIDYLKEAGGLEAASRTTPFIRLIGILLEGSPPDSGLASPLVTLFEGLEEDERASVAF